MKIMYTNDHSLHTNIFHSTRIHLNGDCNVMSSPFCYIKGKRVISPEAAQVICFAADVYEITLEDDDIGKLIKVETTDGRDLYCKGGICFTPCPDAFNVEGYNIDDEGWVFMSLTDVYELPHYIRAEDIKCITTCDAKELDERY